MVCGRPRCSACGRPWPEGISWKNFGSKKSLRWFWGPYLSVRICRGLKNPWSASRVLASLRIFLPHQQCASLSCWSSTPRVKPVDKNFRTKGSASSQSITTKEFCSRSSREICPRSYSGPKSWRKFKIFVNFQARLKFSKRATFILKPLFFLWGILKVEYFENLSSDSLSNFQAKNSIQITFKIVNPYSGSANYYRGSDWLAFDLSTAVF